MSSTAVSLTSYLLCISISVVIQWLLLKMSVWTCETSSLSFISFKKCVTNSLRLSPQLTFCFFLGPWFGIITQLIIQIWKLWLVQNTTSNPSITHGWSREFVVRNVFFTILVAYWGSCVPVKLYRGGTGLACRSIKDGGWDGGWESQDLLVKTYVLQITMNDNKPVNQGSQKLKYKRKREGEVYTGSKQLRSEGFSWWTSLLLGTDCTLQRDSTLPRLSTAECELKQPENSLCTEEN